MEIYFLQLARVMARLRLILVIYVLVQLLLLLEINVLEPLISVNILHHLSCFKVPQNSLFSFISAFWQLFLLPSHSCGSYYQPVFVKTAVQMANRDLMNTYIVVVGHPWRRLNSHSLASSSQLHVLSWKLTLRGRQSVTGMKESSGPGQSHAPAVPQVVCVTLRYVAKWHVPIFRCWKPPQKDCWPHS